MYPTTNLKDFVSATIDRPIILLLRNRSQLITISTKTFASQTRKIMYDIERALTDVSCAV